MADVASLVFDIDASGADGAARALAGLNRYAAATATMTAKLEKQGRSANGQFLSYTETVARAEAEIRSLASAYNPVLNAQLRMAEQQKDLARAVQLGVITSDQQAVALRGLESAYNRSVQSGNRFFKVIGGGVGQVQNASYQVGDFFVQVASGQNVMMALSQQLPQLLGGFGAIGAAAGAVAAILGAAWMVMGAGESATDRLTKSLDKLNDAIGEVRSLSASVSLAGLDALREKYGQVNTSVMRLIENQRVYNQMVASNELKTSLDALADVAGGRWFDIGINDFTSGVLKLQSAFSLTRNDAESLKSAFDDIGKAKSLSEQEAALQKVSDYLRIVLSNSKNVTSEQLETFGAVNKSLDAVKQLLAVSQRMPGAFENAAAAAGRIADRLNEAVSSAARLAASAVSDVRFAQIELDFRTDNVAKAGAIAAARFDAEVGSSGMDAGLYNRMRTQAIEGAKEAARIMGEVERRNEADRKAASSANKGAGAEATALKQAEKQFQSIRELLEKETVFQFAEYEKRHAQLTNALNREQLTKEQYAKIEQQLRTLYFGTEYAQRQVEYDMSLEQLRRALELEYLTRQEYENKKTQLQWQYSNAALDLNSTQLGAQLNGLAGYFSQASSLAGGSYSGLLKAQQTFAASSALISAYSGAAQALADPTLTTWQKIAAAGKVLTTGLGFVSAIKSGGNAGGSGGVSSSVATQQAEPMRQTTVRIEGDTIFSGMMESIVQSLWDRSKDGELIIYQGGR